MIATAAGTTLASFVVAFAAACVVTRLALRIAPRDAATQEAHKRDQRAVPLVGAIVAFALIALAILLVATVATVANVSTAGALARAWPLPVVAGLLVATSLGFMDDVRKRRGLAWPIKLAIQAAAAATLAFVDPASLAFGAGPHARLFACAFTLLAMNAWNLFDNFDGAATLTALAMLGLMLMRTPAHGELALDVVYVAGALLGFLPWHWPRTRCYLGDGGSHALGFALAWLALRDTEGPRAALAFHTLPMLDMAHVVVVRLGLGIAPWRGDKRHLAHRLAAMRGSKDRLVAPILALLAALAAACLL